MTSGYKFIPRASVRMTRWNQAVPGEYVVDHRTHITFYFMGDNKHLVWLNRLRRYGRRRGPARGEYYFGEQEWRIKLPQRLVSPAGGPGDSRRASRQGRRS